jgi:glycosyltransferase involved in cell wall biosynthesis
MKILHISKSNSGGAGRAAYRLHQGLQKMGINSQMLVQNKFGDDGSVLCPETQLKKAMAKLEILNRLDKLPLKFYPKRSPDLFSPQWTPDTIAPEVARITPDLINLHWVGQGYVKIETLSKLNKPLVWTLHDMWPLTGGCFYSADCDRYTNSCGSCPQLGSNRDRDLSWWVWKRKVKAWRNLNLTIISPSIWLAKCASSSSLFSNFRVEVIPHGIELQTYKPIKQQLAREIFNFSKNKQLVLFGAISATSDRRKGFELLQLALQKLSKSGWKDKIELIVFGASTPKNPPDLGFKTHYLGHLYDNTSLTILYSAADVMVVPSYQESFGQTASESLACGLPVVAFNATGLKDIVDHQENGYLAKPYNVEDLAQGIIWVLGDKNRHQKLCLSAREKAEQEFTLELQARRYLSLFTDILNTGRS